MISILIPVYNTSVVDLVRDLHRQGQAMGVPFEIICLDDRSDRAYRLLNAVIKGLPEVRYLELPGNIGRSRIRNRLVDLAQQPYLLFMDGDSRVVSTDYLKNYVAALAADTIIYGGRTYREIPPEDEACIFHWYYGKEREALPAARRRLHPYRTFMTNNFMVPLAVASIIRFDESIRRYGYEDTLYALELQKAGYRIVHLDNPLEHLGLEEQPVFLRKIEEALDNLRDLLPAHPEIDTRLLQLVRRLQAWYLLGGVRKAAYWLRPGLKKVLLRRSRPALWLLDLYKLCYFIQ